MKLIIQVILYNKLLADLWDQLYSCSITKEQYIQMKEAWLLKNGSEELFQELIDLEKSQNAKEELTIIREKWRNK